MSFEGSLRETPLHMVLDAIGSERQTGILTVQDAQEIVAVTFLRGEIVGADSLSGGDEILGQALAEAHVVRPDEFAAVVAIHRTGGGRVSDLLLQRGLLDRPTLLRGLRTQSLILLRTVMHWPDGTYKFYTGEDLSFEEGFDPIDVDEVIGHGGSFGASARSVLRDSGTGAHELFGAPEPAAPVVPLFPEPAPAASVDRPILARQEEPPPLTTILASIAGSASPEAAQAEIHGRPESTPVPRVKRVHGGALGEAHEPPFGAGPPAPKADTAGAVRSQGTGRAMGLRGAIWLAACLVLPAMLAGLFPSQLLAPLPWAGGGYGELYERRREGVFRRIDAAARTYCLVEGQYPPDLDVLFSQGLLGRRDLRTAAGETVVYSGTGDSYALRTIQGGRLSGDSSVESTAGNIFLDAAFTENAGTESKPLVLLD